MKKAHYEETTGKLLGWYDKKIHTTIPTPNIEVTDAVWKAAISINANYVDAAKKTVSVKDFRTTGEIEEDAMAAKWAEIATFWAALTVTINTHKYKADEAGANRMALKRDALAADATTTWYEDWGSFTTNKVDLQDAITQADTDLQTFIDATMAGV